eukprot:g8088.t1
MQGGEASALLEVNATPTTTTTYESLGHGICACRNPTRKNGLELDLCNSDVYVQGWVPAPAPEEFSCRRLCSDAADCMAYQEYSETERSQYRDSFQYEKTNSTQQGEGVLRRWCLLWQWHRVPIGVFRWEDIFGRSDFSESLKRGLDLWKSVPCMRKVVQLTDGRSRFQLESVEKFAIMPRERDVREGNGHGLDRFCTCRATTPTGGDDTEEKETVCRVADERVNMSQEAAESLCLERNRREAALLRGSTNEKDIKSAFGGCAGFMSFTRGTPRPDAPHDRMHPKANHRLGRHFLLGSGLWHTRELIISRGACITWEITMDVRRGRGALGLGRRSVWKSRGTLGRRSVWKFRGTLGRRSVWKFCLTSPSGE